MRDVAVAVFLVLCIALAMRKPWYGVISLAIFSYLNPHAYAWSWARTFPAYLILFLVVVVVTFFSRREERQPLPSDWRVPAFFVLWFYFFLTTTQAYIQDAAWERLWAVSKIYLPFVFTLILINSRQKLYYLIATIAASIGLIAVKGGLFALGTGFSYRVYGPPATQFEENNAFAIATLIAVPLVLLVQRESKSRWIQLGAYAALPLMFASVLSSWSRGALLTLGVLIFMTLWHSKRKWLVVPFAACSIAVGISVLPEQWFGRMQTLKSYDEDESAKGRLEVWADGLNHTLYERPLVGTGFEGWRWITQRDWHSSYVEMLAEHGLIAFGIWISMILGTVGSLSSLPRRTQGIPGLEWVSSYCRAIRMSLICYMVGTAFLGLSYWDLLYHLIFIAVLIKKFAMEDLEAHFAGQASAPRGARPGKLTGIAARAPRFAAPRNGGTG